jgi:hypothetical protein
MSWGNHPARLQLVDEDLLNCCFGEGIKSGGMHHDMK